MAAHTPQPPGGSGEHPALNRAFSLSPVRSDVGHLLVHVATRPGQREKGGFGSPGKQDAGVPQVPGPVTMHSGRRSKPDRTEIHRTTAECSLVRSDSSAARDFDSGSTTGTASPDHEAAWCGSVVTLGDASAVWSDRCGWAELLAGGDALGNGRESLALGEGWPRQWTTHWRKSLVRPGRGGGR